jgi:hypothetical protein
VLASVAGLLAVVGGAGCTGAEPRRDSADPAAAITGAGGSESPPSTKAPATAAPLPSIVARVSEAPHGLLLAVENHGPGEVSLRTTVTVTRDGSAAPPLLLRSDCAAPPPECRTLLPGAALEPPVWLDGQCTTPKLGARAEGTHTFTVSACDGREAVTAQWSRDSAPHSG